MRIRRIRGAFAGIFLCAICLACGMGNIDHVIHPPTAQSVCADLVTAGIAVNCHRITPGGASARARERYDFDLVSVPGHGGAVMSFDTDEDYDWTVDFYARTAVFAGPHRYGNRARRIFVQMNEGAPFDVGDATRRIIEQE